MGLDNACAVLTVDKAEAHTLFIYMTYKKYVHVPCMYTYEASQVAQR